MSYGYRLSCLIVKESELIVSAPSITGPKLNSPSIIVVWGELIILSSAVALSKSTPLLSRFAWYSYSKTVLLILFLLTRV